METYTKIDTMYKRYAFDGKNCPKKEWLKFRNKIRHDHRLRHRSEQGDGLQGDARRDRRDSELHVRRQRGRRTGHQ